MQYFSKLLCHQLEQSKQGGRSEWDLPDFFLECFVSVQLSAYSYLISLYPEFYFSSYHAIPYRVHSLHSTFLLKLLCSFTSCLDSNEYTMPSGNLPRNFPARVFYLYSLSVAVNILTHLVLYHPSVLSFCLATVPSFSSSS